MTLNEDFFHGMIVASLIWSLLGFLYTDWNYRTMKKVTKVVDEMIANFKKATSALEIELTARAERIEKLEAALRAKG